MREYVELDGYPAKQREALIAEFELAYPEYMRQLIVGTSVVPVVLLIVSLVTIRGGVVLWWLAPLLVVACVGVALSAWWLIRRHEHRFLMRLIESRACVCGYSLLGMQAVDVWITCPECGAEYRPEPYELTAQGLIATPQMIAGETSRPPT